ncbi:DUF4097 family beta strand repeat-containing protein [Streptomyces sp. NPDC052701]|uniref:DUF4097 family beta strand repeat-containing protein n=1 Tax=Streptomyces sp. NPDC052701 TaxID=3155533 RepID=UPI00343F1FD1
MYEFKADGPVTARVRITGGSCAVRAGDGPGVTVEVAPAVSWRSGDRKAADSTEVSYDNGVLSVDRGQPGDRIKGRIRLTITVPAGSALEYASDSAGLVTSGPLAALVADTGSGAVEADSVTGDVRLDLASGDTRLGSVGGSLTFATRSGGVRVAHAGGPVSGRSASGDMRLGTAEREVRVETSSGDVRIETVRGGLVHATTSSGDVSVGVAPGLGVRPSLHTRSGDRHGDLADGAPSEGGAEVTVDITTASGDITLCRA